MARAENLIPILLSWEGGFVDDPIDLGGATNKGVTLKTFKQFYGRDKTVFDLKNITNEQWLYIFKKGYWDVCKADLIESQSVANMVVDFYYNSGFHSIKTLQKVLNISVDGVVGVNTLRAINLCRAEELFDKYKKARLDFLEEICENRPLNNKFLRGWQNRVNSFSFKE